MKLFWFKLYAAFRYDPKMQALSEIMQRRFVILMCMHCEAELLGRTDKEMRAALGISLKQWLETKALFIAKRLIDAQLNILNWEKYQAQILINGAQSKRASMTNAERQAGYRGRKKEKTLTEGVTEGVTGVTEGVTGVTEGVTGVTEGVTKAVTSMGTQPKKSPENSLKNQEVIARNENPLDIDIDIDKDIDLDVDNRNLRSNSKSIAPHAAACAAPPSSARTFVAEFELPATASPKPKPESQSAASTAVTPAPVPAAPAVDAAIDYAAIWARLSKPQRCAVLQWVGARPEDWERSAPAPWRAFPTRTQQHFSQAIEALGLRQPATAPAADDRPTAAPESHNPAAQTESVPADPAVDLKTPKIDPATQAAPPPANPDSDLNAMGAPLTLKNDPDKGFIHADPKATKNERLQTVSEKPAKSRPAVMVAEAVDEDEKPRRQSSKSRKKELTQEQKNLNSTIWQRYRAAYIERYGIAADPEPVRNEKINSQINSLRKRLGHEAPDVAAFYVGINDHFLIRTSHNVGTLLQGCEGYRTQWATGRQVNAVTARQMENTQANIEAIKQVNTRLKSGYVNPLAALMAEAEAEERAQLLERKQA